MSEITTRVATMDDYDAIVVLLAQSDDYHATLLPEIYRSYDGPARSRDRSVRL